jgi:hypothetical protein
LAEIAPGNFRGHYFVGRRQKAWFLPAAPMQGACGALAALSAHVSPTPDPRAGVDHATSGLLLTAL